MPQFQIFSDEQIESLRKGGKILRDCLNFVSKMVKPGVMTKDLDEAAQMFIRDRGGVPGFKGYQGYPATLCTSVNEECVHGIPGDRVLNEGDIVAIDCGVLFDDLYTDACVTVPVGKISSDAQKLLDVTQEALKKALTVLKAGVHVGDISSTVQQTVESEGFTVIRALTGHGLGSTLHQFPDVPNFGKAGKGPEIPAKTILAIEPITSVGKSSSVLETGDGWTLVTKDRALSAHFEHTVLVMDDNCEIIA